MRHFYFFFRWLFIELCYMLWLVLFTEKTGYFMLGVTEILPQMLVTKTVLYITKVVIRSSYCISWATSNVKVFWTFYPYHGEWRRLPVILIWTVKRILKMLFPGCFSTQQTWTGKLLLFEGASLIKKETVASFLNKGTVLFSCQ